MAWSGEHRAFVIEGLVKNGESVVATQRSFRRHFSLNRHDPIPTGKTIHCWVSNFQQTLPFGVLWAVLGGGVLTFLKRKVLQ